MTMGTSGMAEIARSMKRLRAPKGNVDPIDKTKSLDVEKYRERVTALPHEAVVEMYLDVAGDYLPDDEIEDTIAAIEEETIPEEEPLEEIPAEPVEENQVVIEPERKTSGKRAY